MGISLGSIRDYFWDEFGYHLGILEGSSRDRFGIWHHVGISLVSH